MDTRKLEVDITEVRGFLWGIHTNYSMYVTMLRLLARHDIRLTRVALGHKMHYDGQNWQLLI